LPATGASTSPRPTGQSPGEDEPDDESDEEDEPLVAERLLIGDGVVEPFASDIDTIRSRLLVDAPASSVQIQDAGKSTIGKRSAPDTPEKDGGEGTSRKLRRTGTMAATAKEGREFLARSHSSDLPKGDDPIEAWNDPLLG